MKNARKTELGTVHCASAMMFRTVCGEAHNVAEHSYEIATSVHGNPIITSKQTNQKWSISWNELLELAVKNGIDKPFADIAEASRGA